MEASLLWVLSVTLIMAGFFGTVLPFLPGTVLVRVGAATWIGIIVGLLAKVVIAFMMVGIFIAAFLL